MILKRAADLIEFVCARTHYPHLIHSENAITNYENAAAHAAAAAAASSEYDARNNSSPNTIYTNGHGTPDPLVAPTSNYGSSPTANNQNQAPNSQHLGTFKSRFGL